MQHVIDGADDSTSYGAMMNLADAYRVEYISSFITKVVRRCDC